VLAALLAMRLRQFSTQKGWVANEEMNLHAFLLVVSASRVSFLTCSHPRGYGF